MFRCLFRVTGAKKPLPAKDRGADDKGCEGRRAQKSLPRIAGDIAFPRRNKGNRLKCGAGRTLPGNEPEGRVTKKGYNRICFRVHLYALICSCNLLKSKTGRRMTASFHAVDRGSNPLGDAKRNQALTRNRKGFFVVGQNCPAICPTRKIFCDVPKILSLKKTLQRPSFPVWFSFAPFVKQDNGGGTSFSS